MDVRTALIALALTAGCRTTAQTSTPPATTGPAAAAPTPFDDLNLGFEQADTPEGWKVARSKYPVSIDAESAFEGEHSLKLVHDGVHKSGRISIELPVDEVRGKKLRAQAHVRTEGVSHGSVKLRLYAARGDDGLGRKETAPAEQLRGDQDWTPVAVELAIPSEVDEVTLTLDHAGSGTAWFDGIELALFDVEAPPPPASLTGTVVDASGQAVAGALVAVISQTGESEVLETDDQGRFSAELEPGPWQVGASATGGVAHAPPVAIEPGDNDPVALTLAAGTQRLHGTVVDQDDRAYGGALAVVATADGRFFPTRTADDGAWSITVPASDQYALVLQGGVGQRMMTMVEDANTKLESSLHREGAAPPAAVQWIRDHHVPLRTVEAGQGLDDMAGLDSMFAEATVVGLGETTHGTREFFQFKHRMLEYLVERHGFTVFGIEANRTECRAIDRYVQTGEGDPKDALAGIYFWTWDTEEVLDLIEWMRQYNASHEKKLHFVGFDAQTPDVAARNVDAFLTTVDPSAPQREAVAIFGRPWNAEAYSALTSDQREEIRESLDALAQRFEDRRAPWTTATSADAFADALEDLTVVRQVLTQRSVPPMESFAARDRAMADNVLHIEQRYGKGTKAVLWAHNGHVARAWTQSDVMGKYIGEALGDRYVSVGFAFDHGGFQAIAIENNEMVALREHVVGPAGSGEIEAALREGGPELFALSLRALPRKGKAAKWLRSPLPMRQIGAGFGKDDMSARVVEPIPDRFDVLLFVEETSRARPVHRD